LSAWIKTAWESGNGISVEVFQIVGSMMSFGVYKISTKINGRDLILVNVKLEK
jgi:hypothetical protein